MNRLSNNIKFWNWLPYTGVFIAFQLGAITHHLIPGIFLYLHTNDDNVDDNSTISSSASIPRIINPSPPPTVSPPSPTSVVNFPFFVPINNSYDSDLDLEIV